MSRLKPVNGSIAAAAISRLPSCTRGSSISYQPSGTVARAARRPPITRRLGMLSHRLPQTLRRGRRCYLTRTVQFVQRSAFSVGAVASHAARRGCATAPAALPSNEMSISSPRYRTASSCELALDSRSTPGRTIAHRRERPHKGNSPADVRRARLFARDRPHELGGAPRNRLRRFEPHGCPILDVNVLRP